MVRESGKKNVELYRKHFPVIFLLTFPGLLEYGADLPSSSGRLTPQSKLVMEKLRLSL